MGKIGVKYLEGSVVIKQVNKVIGILGKEDKYLKDALNEFEEIVLSYSKSGELSSAINEIRDNIREDKYKLELFNSRLKKYIDMVQDADSSLTVKI